MSCKSLNWDVGKRFVLAECDINQFYVSLSCTKHVRITLTQTAEHACAHTQDDTV